MSAGSHAWPYHRGVKIDPLTGLPTRGRLVAAIDEMISGGDDPAVFCVAVEGFDLPDPDPDPDVAKALREVASRLSQLVRSNDVLASAAPGVFALAGTGVEAGDADVVMDRVRGVFALPVEIGAEVFSLSINVGFAPAARGMNGAELVALAETDLLRRSGT